MNERQRKLVAVLAAESRHYSIEEVRKELRCSEKTIRNDLKFLDEWLKVHSPQVTIIRKPSLGVWLEGEEIKKQQLLEMIKTNKQKSREGGRKYELLKLLLEGAETYTIQELADELYTNKVLIRDDLVKVEKWLELFGLRLVRKQNLGVKIEGEEENWRTALLSMTRHFSQGQDNSRWFEPFEQALVKEVINRLETEWPFSFTDESRKNLVFHILISIKRMKQGKKIQMKPEEIQRLLKKKKAFLLRRLSRNLSVHFLSFSPGQKLPT
ncbi:BglG family transcription antiterminator [Aneurinibacillus terranovensis]|uniref:BglG family transcription antiterminator n=1 Tax=Aneurinibacillus terranovensis TaxID=278991 RepID=UPI00042384BE|nr:helix-turn-helix domain-containing protein [Aneurinibacillus terranovensis]